MKKALLLIFLCSHSILGHTAGNEHTETIKPKKFLTCLLTTLNKKISEYSQKEGDLSKRICENLSRESRISLIQHFSSRFEYREDENMYYDRHERMLGVSVDTVYNTLKPHIKCYQSSSNLGGLFIDIFINAHHDRNRRLLSHTLGAMLDKEGSYYDYYPRDYLSELEFKGCK
ncbi:MAG: hypothetical protein QF441_08415 [Bacteriovoracaceae bacterium]|jgi:hypothetical protein|nr:hypothetical protein [Halobacteriovoraceae bacterium]MDP7320618.1 hypothetical protein [Bacteriovoracaceae bacterium]|tara:strand:+ start:400 stop:918 length:519 start_codon:yes stop_codon:yes gene_type:complete